MRLVARRDTHRAACAGIVLLIDDRPLVSNDGQPTMFCDAAAARRFLELARIRRYEFAEADAVERAATTNRRIASRCRAAV